MKDNSKLPVFEDAFFKSELITSKVKPHFMFPQSIPTETSINFAHGLNRGQNK
jgi:hypothetical protein